MTQAESRDYRRSRQTATRGDRQRHGRRAARRGRHRPRRRDASTSRCSVTSRTATTTASSSRASWPAPTTPRTSSSTRSTGTRRTTSRCTPACASRASTATLPRVLRRRRSSGRLRPLVIATGSSPFVPPTRGPAQPRRRRDSQGGVFVFRTLDDCHDDLRYAQRRTRAAVIGGGLLGLEAARGLLELGLEVHVVHLMSHLMEVQLDPRRGRRARRTLERDGRAASISRRRPPACSASSHVEGLAFADGTTLDCELVVISAGIRPNIALARDRRA